MKKRIINKFANKDGVQTVYLYNGFKVSVSRNYFKGVRTEKGFSAIIFENNHNGVALDYVTATYSTLLWAKIDKAITNVMHGRIAEIYRDFCEINSNSRVRVENIKNVKHGKFADVYRELCEKYNTK